MPGSLDLIFKVLCFLGCWPLEGVTRYIFLKNLIHTTIAYFSISTLVVVQLAYIVQKVDNLEKLSDAIFLPLTIFGLIIKLWNFIPKRPTIKQLLNILNDEMFCPKNERQRKLLKTAMVSYRRTYVLFVLMGFCTILLWAIFPFLEMNPENSEKRLLVSAWYPFNFQQNPGYTFAYIHQIITIPIMATINITMDCLLPGFMAYISAQLELLCDSQEHILEEVEKKLELSFQKNDKELHKEMAKAQRECILHHLGILQVSNDINSIFNLPTLGQLALSVFTICITLFELTLVTPMSIQFLSMILYQICMLMELFLFCWYGNDILLKSRELLTALYKSNWTDCTFSYKRTMIIMMIRTHRPIKLYAGNLFILSLETFVKILRSSWSYFAVLQSVHNQ